jgi:hypothetical protein
MGDDAQLPGMNAIRAVGYAPNVQVTPRAGMGRPKGSKNKFTTNIKEAIFESFQRLGGADYLEEQGRKNPVAYLMLLKTVMPLQVSGVRRAGRS